MSNYRNSSHLESDLLSRFEYSCYADGQRATAEEKLRQGSSYTTTQIIWKYDALNRLTSETIGTQLPIVYKYDLVGNRVLKGHLDSGNYVNDISYSYNAMDQMYLEDYVSGQDITYVYDGNGSLESQTQNGSTTAYVYDLRNRLKTVTADSVTTTYGYSPEGSRVRRQIGTGTPTVYLIDPANPTGYSQILQETTGSTTTTYILGSDVIGQAVGSATPQSLMYDGHGSVRQMAASTGTLVTGQEFDYDAYGNLTNTVTPQTQLLYCGEQYDSTLKMYNLRARWYSPATGRFNAIDPYEGSPYDPPSLHRYLFCHSDPINRIDPSGLFSLNEINVVQAIQNKLKQVWNSKSIKFLRRGVDPTRQRWKMWLIQSKGMPIHFGLWLEVLNNIGEETGIGPYFDVNPTTGGLRRLLSGSVFRYIKIVPGRLNVSVKSDFEITFMATGKWKICSFTHPQFGLWTAAAVGASYAEDLTVPVQFNLFFIPGTLNCTKWVAEAITLALPISILPI